MKITESELEELREIADLLNTAKMPTEEKRVTALITKLHQMKPLTIGYLGTYSDLDIPLSNEDFYFFVCGYCRRVPTIREYEDRKRTITLDLKKMMI